MRIERISCNGRPPHLQIVAAHWWDQLVEESRALLLSLSVSLCLSLSSLSLSFSLSYSSCTPFVLLDPRHSGLHPSKFPRPREGSRALDAVMLPLLDIEVT